MTFDKYERYEVTNVPEGLSISLWQALPRFGIGVMALVILAACFVTDQHPGHGRIWAGLGVIALVLVALFGVRIESTVVSDSAVRYKGSLWSKELVFERPPSTPLILHVERVPNDSEGTQPPFPHVVHLIGPDGMEVGEGFQFREKSTLERFLQAIHDVSPIQVTDLLSAKESTDELFPGISRRRHQGAHEELVDDRPQRGDTNE